MTIKINQFEAEDVKKIKAVKLEPSANGLTIIGGDNAQGKTSVLDSIAWALGGAKFTPSKPKRDGSMAYPYLKVELSNGIVVERKGSNSSLTVTDKNGMKGGQKLLDSFIEELALNLPKFMNATSKEKANILLQILGVGEELNKLDQEERDLYQERLLTGREFEKKDKHAKDLVFYADVPSTPISAGELISQQQEIMAHNAENARKRMKVAEYERNRASIEEQLEAIRTRLREKEEEYETLLKDLEIAKKDVLDLFDESTEELEENISRIDEINSYVRKNQEKLDAEKEAKDLGERYSDLTQKIERVRNDRLKLIEGAALPLEGLSVEDGEITYKGQHWDNMSGAEQLRVATAIVKCLKPECGFVLLDKLEQFDLNTLNEFGKWLEEQDLQVIATRVSKGSECSIIIEDGKVLEERKKEEPKKMEWSM